MKDNCSQIDDYLAGALDADQNADFRRHLVSCSKCQTELALDAELDQRIRDAWSHVLPDHDGVQRLPVASSVEKSSTTFWAGLTVLVLAATLAGLALFFRGNLTDPGDPVAIPRINPSRPNDPSLTRSTVAVVTFLDLGEGADALLIPNKQQDPRFTIVKAYKPMIINPSNGSTEDEQTN